MCVSGCVSRTYVGNASFPKTVWMQGEPYSGSRRGNEGFQWYKHELYVIAQAHFIYTSSWLNSMRHSHSLTSLQGERIEMVKVTKLMCGDKNRLIDKAKAAHTDKAKNSYATSFCYPQERSPSCVALTCEEKRRQSERPCLPSSSPTIMS